MRALSAIGRGCRCSEEDAARAIARFNPLTPFPLFCLDRGHLLHGRMAERGLHSSVRGHPMGLTFLNGLKHVA